MNEIKQSEAPQLKLCSDLNSFNYRITFHFCDISTGELIGPRFSTKEHAQEWYQRWLSCFYFGEDRRKSAADRRRQDKRTAFELRAEGRRRADEPVEFEDRVGWMLTDLAKLRRGKADA